MIRSYDRLPAVLKDGPCIVMRSVVRNPFITDAVSYEYHIVRDPLSEIVYQTTNEVAWKYIEEHGLVKTHSLKGCGVIYDSPDKRFQQIFGGILGEKNASSSFNLIWGGQSC